MLKYNLLSGKTVSKSLFLGMMLLCWGMTLFQSASTRIKARQAVPAFQNETTPASEEIPAYQTDILSSPKENLIFQSEKSQTWELSLGSGQFTPETAPSGCLALAKKLDADTTLISSHSGKRYSDFYFSSPALEKQLQIAPMSATGSNLQIAIVWNKDKSCKHIYLGIPYIEYSF